MNTSTCDLTGTTRFLRLLLLLGAAMAVVALLSSFMQLDLLSRNYSEAEAESNDLRQQVIGLLELGLYVFTAIIFGRWVISANKNVRALGADGLTVTPGWAVGYFFVPVVNLWKPYQAMKDLWKASQNPFAWQTVPAPGVLAVWWGLWIASNVLGQAAFRTMMRAEGVDGLRNVTYIQMLSEAVDLPLCLIAMVVVSHISRAQNAAAHDAPNTSGTGQLTPVTFSGS